MFPVYVHWGMTLRTGRGCYWRAEYLGARNADDPEDVPLCRRGEHERHARGTAFEGDHQCL